MTDRIEKWNKKYGKEKKPEESKKKSISLGEMNRIMEDFENQIAVIEEKLHTTGLLESQKLELWSKLGILLSVKDKYIEIYESITGTRYL